MDAPPEGAAGRQPVARRWRLMVLAAALVGLAALLAPHALDFSGSRSVGYYRSRDVRLVWAERVGPGRFKMRFVTERETGFYCGGIEVEGGTHGGRPLLRFVRAGAASRRPPAFSIELTMPDADPAVIVQGPRNEDWGVIELRDFLGNPSKGSDAQRAK